MKIVVTKSFPGFEFSSDKLVKYIEASGLFSILLKGGQIIHFKPDDPNDFRNWLAEIGLVNIREKIK
ncbi:hypothetical protein [Niabella aquatica]